MKVLHFILLLIVSLVTTTAVQAQQGTTLITGTIAEKANAEITVFKTINNKTEMLAVYHVYSASPEFTFALPVEPNAGYRLQINLLKQGHMRLELDKRFSFPLRLQAGQNLSMRITPSVLNEAKKTGVELKKNTQYPSLAFVSGNLVNSVFGAGLITLQKVTDGELTTVAGFTTTKTNKRFLLTLPVKEEGFYYVSSVRFRCRIYLKPADAAELIINAHTGEYDLINGSEENRLMEKWHKLSLPITDYGYFRSIFQNDSLKFDNYLSKYEKLQTAIKDFKQTNKLSNERFNHLFQIAVDVDNSYAPLYLFSSLSAKKNGKYISSRKTINEPPVFFKQFISENKFNDANILKLGEALSYINLYQQLNFAFMAEADKKNLWKDDKMKIMMNVISNDTVKAVFLKSQMETVEVNNLSEFKAIYQPFEKYTFLPAVKKKYQQVYEGFIGDTAIIGKSSYNFSLPDTTGKMVSMKDFKGKVIFIDVWATWCGPCREQFPYLKEIEEEYKNNEHIVFMGISLDREKDKQKWLTQIKKEDLHGIQLLDDVGKSFGRKYGITAIPRFLLIDKQGNWIEIRCPKPEAKEELKRYIDKALREVYITQN